MHVLTRFSDAVAVLNRYRFMFSLQMATMMGIPARVMAGKRSQTIEENMATKADMAILQDLVKMAGIHTAKTQFGETVMTKTSE